MHTLEQNVKHFSAKDPAAQTATFNGDTIDCKELGRFLELVLQIGAVSGTSPTLDVKLTESDDNFASDDTDIANGAFVQYTDSDANSIKSLSALRTKRYVRAVFTLAGTSPNFLLAPVLNVEGRKQGTALNDSSAA